MGRSKIQRKQLAAIAKSKECPSVKDKMKTASREVSSRPGVNERRSASAKATMSTPEYKAKWKASMSRPETIAQQSANMKTAVNNPEYKAKKLASQIATAEKKRRVAHPEWTEEQHQKRNMVLALRREQRID